VIGTMKDRRIVAAGGFAIVAIAIGAFAIVHGKPAGSCYAGDAKAPSTVADRALYAAASEVRGTGPVVVETIHGDLLRQRTKFAVDGGSVVELAGWAVDPVAKRAATVVLVRVDDRPPLRADTCRDRSDVAQFSGVPAYGPSGFEVRLQPAPGVHRLAFSVLADDGRTLYVDPRDLELDVARPAVSRAAPIRTIPSVQGGFTGLDDAAVPAAVSAGAPFSHPVGTDFRINGWMIDRTRAAPAPLRSIDVLVDGRLVDHAAYGASRPDVADFLHAPDLRNLGFTARFATDGMRPGRHVVTLRAVVADGRSATFATRLVVDLTPDPAG